MIKLWKIGNDKHHRWDAESHKSARHKMMHKEMEAIYNRKHEYPLRVQRLLQGSYAIHIQEMATKIADWLYASKGTFAVTWSPWTDQLT
jgi:hypothetical protein